MAEVKTPEDKATGEPLAYWPDDKSTNIVCDETYEALSEPIDFSTDNMKTICTEHTSQLCKFSPEIVIGEPDTFILSQLVKLRNLEFSESHSVVNSIHINTSNFIFFALMRDNMKKMFIELRDEHLAHLGYPETEEFIIDFTLIFLEDCLKRATEKAKCQ